MMTMINRFEIITTSIRPSTTSMMDVSLSLVDSGAPGTATAVSTCCKAASLPNTAPIRSDSSTQKWNTYTQWARMKPRYSGSCNQREMKMKADKGCNLVGMDFFWWSVIWRFPEINAIFCYARYFTRAGGQCAWPCFGLLTLMKDKVVLTIRYIL